MTPLPLTVISGYLGAGKTTLVNRLLADPQGLRLMVMVNDFGAINIDQSLIAARDEDVIALTNGCVCCTMGADLFMAIGDALDRRPRPDHLIIEASGVADPRAIANAAIAEPDLRYAGIVTLVDALNAGTLVADPLVGAQVRHQIAAADVVLQTKRADRDPALDALLTAHGLPLPRLMDQTALSVLMLGGTETRTPAPGAPHPAYCAWQHSSKATVPAARLRAGLAEPPAGLYRLKGFVRTDEGSLEVHLVGRIFDLRPVSDQPETRLVALGPSDLIRPQDIDTWWAGIATTA